jgi:TolB protein
MRKRKEPREREGGGLAAVGRGLRGLGRRILAVPVGLVRFAFNLPAWLWRGLKGLPRWPLGLPGRVRRGLQRLAFELYRLRPRAQRVALAALGINLVVVALLSVALLRLARRTPAVVVVTATPMRTGGLAVVRATPASALATPVPDALLAPLSPRPIGGGGVVAFASRRDGNTDIYARKLDDDQLLRLTYDPAEDRQAAWAPDGETLAFVSQRGNNWDIYRLDLVSGALIRLTRHPHYDAHPSWSPDGAFIAFESYRSGNLDVYIMAADGSQTFQLTANPAADFAPAWSPDGRHIAFVSYRAGSKDIFIYPLDAGSESAVINLTQTPDRDEDAPAWSPDGSRLAFSVGRTGGETIHIATLAWKGRSLAEALIQPFNPGTRPDWSPDGTSLVYEYQGAGNAYLLAYNATGWGAGQEVYGGDVREPPLAPPATLALPGPLPWPGRARDGRGAGESNVAPAQDPSWGAPRVDPQILAQQRQSASWVASALYIEEILPTPESGPPYTIVALKDVNGGDDREFLSDRVNDSFEALRERVLEATGTDYLATVGDSFRRIEVPQPPGQSPRSWHKAGRAFDLNQGLYEREERLVELVREDIGLRTFWRVYLRAARQDGSLGEPLRQAPWDLKARRAGGLAAREGGELAQEVPLGYYVDFTALAADYGWERVPANPRWREQWADINWWQFQKPQGLSWLEAMLELYRPDQIEAVFGPLEGEGG